MEEVWDTAKEWMEEGKLSPDTFEMLVEVRAKKALEPPKIIKDFIAKNKQKV